MSSFVHLHVHTQYSILDGQASISALVDKAIADNMPAIAITDHGNMFGVKEFLDYIKKKNAKINDQIKALQAEAEAETDESIKNQKLVEAEKLLTKRFKPIVGCEVYVAANGRLQKNGKEDQSGRHLVLLAKNKRGYHNLMKLVSKAWVDGYYYRPRIDKELLEQYHEGLIASSACLGGEISRLVANGQLEEAEKSVLWFKSLFGDDYYLELQRHPTNDPNADREVYQKQKMVNEHLLNLSQKTGVKIICSNDVHFVEAIHAEAHDHLICLNTGRDLTDPTRMRYSKQEWLKTSQEMAELFADLPHALSNTLEIAEKVEFYDINSKAIMPSFPLPEGFDNDDEYLRHLTYKGADRRYKEVEGEVKERIDFELDTIRKMGFPGYFLIVQDFIAAARNMGVSVGPGRGSAAGSVVAYCLGITDIDPMQYDLLFERFLNPDRISMPDIDIDFDDFGRGQVLQWVTNKYGADRVAHIITFGTMATKSAIKDVARVQKLPLSESDRLSKLVPDKIPNEKKVSLRKAIEYVPELKNAANSDNPLMKNTLRYAQMLEGNIRNTGVHACGIIIGADDLTNFVPISTADDKETGEKMIVTQYEGSVIEDVGMLKMDFLGLKTLSIIKEALSNIEQTTGEKLDISSISIEDKKTYELYSAGRTTGTFQFESAGMQKYLKELQPTKFEDLIAMNALYRPGPMEYIPQFIARKHGREPIEYDIPVMERYLKDTYGITVYQEQVMLLSRLLADFTRGQSDELRKAMGKKLIDKMNALKVKFLDGAKANGHDPKICEKIWADWEKFASYAFNKSHATCYSWVAYQTAYLKANYPSEYMAAVLSRNISDITEIRKFMDECKAMGIQVLGPDVNESFHQFSVNKQGDIRFGLEGIKGVGEAAVSAIVDERKANGPFVDVYDFVQRVNLSICTKKNIESLALAGGFDTIGPFTREQFFADMGRSEVFIETLVRYGNKYQADAAMQTNSLFGESMIVEIQRPKPPVVEPWSDLARLDKERELVGIYLSAHPLDNYAVALEYGCNTKMAELVDKSELVSRNQLTFGGIVVDFREGMTKKGAPFGIIKIEDFSGSGEIPLFGEDFVKYRNFGYIGMYLYIKATIQPRRYDPSVLDLRINEIKPLQEVGPLLIEKIEISMPLEMVNKAEIALLADFLPEDRDSSTILTFNVFDPETGYELTMKANGKKIRPQSTFIDYVKSNENYFCKINGKPCLAVTDSEESEKQLVITEMTEL